MLKRKRFDSTLEVSMYREVQQTLPSECRLKSFLCMQNNTVIGGLLGSAMGDTGIYLQGAINEHGTRTEAAYLLQWSMIKWLKELGVLHYDLNGINPEQNPGGYHFKRGLSGNDMLYMTPLVGCNRIASRVFATAVSMAGPKARASFRRLRGHR